MSEYLTSLQAWEGVLPAEAVETACALAHQAQALRLAGEAIYPPADQVFRALEITAPDRTRVVILGQDPYHAPGQANGLAFSVNAGVKIPASLRNIFIERHRDLGLPPSSSGDLTPWAQQGVLLLNTVLTVPQGKPGGHKSWGWQTLTGAVLRAVFEMHEDSPLVCMLWGKHALETAQRALPDHILNNILNNNINNNIKFIISSHPSPLSARRGFLQYQAFLGSRPFSQCNAFLEEHGAAPLNFNN